MRVALVVGINYYQHGRPLFGCVEDARAVLDVLGRNGDGSRNFDCKPFLAKDAASGLGRRQLRDAVKEVFSIDADVALFYFAGHGHIEATGGYLLTSDSSRGDEGLSLNDVLTYANLSPARNKLVILDSCHSSIAGAAPLHKDLVVLSEGLTVLTASTAEQYASEKDGRGVFTTLFVDALKGSAANLLGAISPGSVYAHIDESLGGFEQRPLFRTNIKKFVSLRNVPPPIELAELRKILKFFPEPGSEFALDPSFEPEMAGREPDAPPPDPENVARFLLLQKMNRLNLVVPVGASKANMWHAAMERTACRLTELGEHYRRLVQKGRI